MKRSKPFSSVMIAPPGAMSPGITVAWEFRWFPLLVLPRDDPDQE
jgi:hypothetical protein